MRVRASRVVALGALIAAATLVIAVLEPIAPVISLGALYSVVVLAVAVLWGLHYAVGGVGRLDARLQLVLPAAGAHVRPRGTEQLDGAARLSRDCSGDERARREDAASSGGGGAPRARRGPARGSRRASARRRRPERAGRTGRESSTEPAAMRLEQAVASLVAIASERERLEREALEAEALRRTDAVKTSVIRSVSHDLRTPLATIEAALDGLGRARRSGWAKPAGRVARRPFATSCSG